MTQKILFYASSSGFGHVARCAAICAEMSPEIETYICSANHDAFFLSGGAKFCELPKLDGVYYFNSPMTFKSFCGDKKESKKYGEHVQKFIELVYAINPDIVVVDVTPEFALYAHMCGYKTALVRITGKKDDQRNLTAYETVDTILVPYPENFTDISYLADHVVRKMRFSGGFSRFDKIVPITKTEAKKALGLDQNKQFIVCTAGEGGIAQSIYDNFQKAMVQFQDVQWQIVRGEKDTEKIATILAAADLAVTGAGDNTVMESARFGIPSIVVFLENAYGEQVAKARDLERWGASICLDGSKLTSETLGTEIRRVILNQQRKEDMTIAQRNLCDGTGAKKMAEIIESLI